MFFKKPKQLPLDHASFERYLRAWKPGPLQWFLGLSEGEQTFLAEIGDARTDDICLGIGYAVADPAAAEAGLHAREDVDAEVDLVKRIATSAVRSMLQKEPPAQDTEGSLSMVDLVKRRTEQVEAKDAGRPESIFGPPTEIAE